jgi:hypothetical protein
MLDYEIGADGIARESSALINRCIKKYLDGFGAEIPHLVAKHTLLGDRLEQRLSAKIEFTNILQAQAHIRAALRQYAVTHYAQRNWQLPFIHLAPNSLVDSAASSNGVYTASELLYTGLLIIAAPTWPRTRMNKEHAANVLQQRLGLRKPTFIYSQDFTSFTTGCQGDDRAFSAEFTNLLNDHPDFGGPTGIIYLDPDLFQSEIKRPKPSVQRG